MYSHANMYGGQPSYGAHAFQPSSYYTSPNQYHQPQYMPPPPPVPQPPPQYHFDPAAFRKDYMNQLAGLIFNSRPLIQTLVMLAQEYSRYADIVVSCVESHIRKVPPQHKLPAFYLLDAISKNVFEPYAKRFASVVTPLFLQTYSQVDEQTRHKMHEMLLTWRTGSPAQRDLFGPVTQLAIERGVWGDGRPTSITRGQVLSELQYAIGRKERELQVNPYDTEARTKLDVMHQLRKLVNAGVSQEELVQIAAQLREQDKPSSQAPPSRSSTWQQPPSQYPPPPPRPSSSSAQYPVAPNTFPAVPYAPPPAPSPQVASTSTPAADAASIAKILDSLKGVLGNPPTQEEPPVDTTPEEPSSVETDAASQAYRDSILAEWSILSSTDILKGKPTVAAFVYDRLPSQCKQCGLRFPDGNYGKKKMNQHLDMHFAQNRKASQSSGRGHSRSWFVSVEDWIHDTSGNDKGKGRADPNTISNATMPSLNELRAQFVVVPPGDEAKNISCPICKEHIKSEFVEDDEEWVWKNAVVKDDKIYHATCHAEAMVSSSGIAARFRSDALGSSRGGTPEVSRSTPPPPSLKQSDSSSPDSKAGVKRKVASDSADESIGTPPNKKLAMANDS